MNIENRATKIMLKNMPPAMAEELFDLYKIKSPYKEILMATCVYDLQQYEAIGVLSMQGINLGYRTLVRKQAKALEIFRLSHLYHNDKATLKV